MDKERNMDRMNFYYIYSRISMLSLGLWPYQSWSSMMTLRSLWIIQHISIMLPELIKIYENRGHFNLLIESLPPFTYNIVMAIKFTNGVLNQRKLKSILEKIKYDWNKFTDKKEIEMLCYYSHRGKSLNTVYIGLVAVVLLSYMLLPMLPAVLDLINPLNESRPKSPLYMVEFYIDQDKYFYSVLTHAYITSLAGVLPLFATDLLFSNCAHHACGIIKILGRRIENILSEEPALKRSYKVDDEKKAIACVIEHQNIIKYCESINSLYTTSFFLILSISIGLMSVTGFVTLIKMNEEFKDCIRFAMFTFAQIFHQFCYYFLGQSVLNHEEKLKDYVSNFNWYKASPKTKFIIKFMIMRTLKPTKIRAMIFPLTLENFTSLMKTTMSYFTVIKSTR
ncbi:odorant receptor 198 [Nasonia vitripennis]|uniref:Odorant receptor n=1 Tax=Nasonia vitripennis TaxID=7425 RepID=A0A7M6UH16_NASVI|nr:odorant receptor 198 [Nasonia vitripennis]